MQMLIFVGFNVSVILELSSSYPSSEILHPRVNMDTLASHHACRNVRRPAGYS
jgi:hypothetical protein